MISGEVNERSCEVGFWPVWRVLVGWGVYVRVELRFFSTVAKCPLLEENSQICLED